MSLSAMIFGENSAIHKVTNVLGLGLPSLLHKWTTPPQPKLAPQMLGEMQDFKVKEGDARAIVFGIGRTIGGTLMYVSDPRRYMVKTYVGEAGGKGGGKKKKKQYQDVEHISRSYAVGICEGEIGAVRRIWKNGKLAFDGRKGSVWGQKNNAAFLKDKEFYLGGYEQLPSPTLQTLLGTDIPAFRGTAYMVVSNEDLTSSNGAVPQYQFEVVRSEGQIITSRPYAVESIESVETKDLSLSSVRLGMPKTSSIESVGTSSLTLKSVGMRKLYKSTTLEPEEVSSNSLSLVSMNLKKVYKSASVQAEEVSSNSLSLVSIKMEAKLIKHSLTPEEVTTSALTLKSINGTTSPVLFAPTSLTGVYNE